MFYILATIDVKDFDKLSSFESKAVEIMSSYEGKIISAFETKRNEDNSGEEVHLIQFPNKEKFSAYRSDSRLNEYAELRNGAINSMSLSVSSKIKSYA